MPYRSLRRLHAAAASGDNHPMQHAFTIHMLLFRTCTNPRARACNHSTHSTPARFLCSTPARFLCSTPGQIIGVTPRVSGFYHRLLLCQLRSAPTSRATRRRLALPRSPWLACKYARAYALARLCVHMCLCVHTDVCACGARRIEFHVRRGVSVQNSCSCNEQPTALFFFAV